MLLSVLFLKLSLENFLSQQRERESDSEQRAVPRWRQSEPELQDLICEWASVKSRVTMRLIDENPHCLCSRSQGSRCTKGVL